MARGIDNWQKPNKTTSYADQIRKQGNAARKTDQLVEKAANLGKPANLDKLQLSKPVSPGKDVAQTHQKIRPETQHEAAKHSDQAAKQYLNAQKQAQNLSKLATTLKSKGTQKPATDNAIISKPNVPQTHATIKQGTQQQSAHIASHLAGAQKTAQKGATKNIIQPKTPKTNSSHKTAKNAEGKSLDAQRTLKSAEQTLQPENAAQGAALAGMSEALTDTARTGRSTDDIDNEDGVEKEEQGRETSTFSAGSSTKARSASNELGGLLGGSAGESNSDSLENNEAVTAEAAKNAQRAEPLPEKDPSLHVYNEDGTAADVKSKAQVFSRLVEKRLYAIAKFDHELEGKIKNMFETAPLSKRIIGDLRDGLSTADFLKSVYGGVIG
ncbi:MAG: hypothetical protein ABH871_07430 [Pseudomonadota bacterium]